MRRSLAVLGGAVTALALYATVVEPWWIEVKRVKIHLRGLPHDLEGLRIALLSDLHAGAWTMGRVRKAVRLAMTESPALVAVTGDFAAERLGSFAPVFRALRGLRPPLGTFAVPGNHDHLMGIGRWRRELAEHSDFIDLTNRSSTLQIGSATLCLAGVDDLDHGRPTLASLPARDERDITILLAHNPLQAERARREDDGIDLIISGHTHAGQVRFPVPGSGREPASASALYEEGIRRRPWTQVYTSRGVGTVHLPVRFLTRPEVSILELTGAPRAPRKRKRSMHLYAPKGGA